MRQDLTADACEHTWRQRFPHRKGPQKPNQWTSGRKGECCPGGAPCRVWLCGTCMHGTRPAGFLISMLPSLTLETDVYRQKGLCSCLALGSSPFALFPRALQRTYQGAQRPREPAGAATMHHLTLRAPHRGPCPETLWGLQ